MWSIAKFCIKFWKRLVGGSVTLSVVVYTLLGGFNDAIGMYRGTNENFSFVAQQANTVIAHWQGIEGIKPNDLNDQLVKERRAEAACDFNPKEWSEGAGGLIKDEKTNIYRMPPNVYSSNIRYIKSISSNAETKFIFTPETKLINTAITYHDLLEVVIGDGDDLGVSVKANLGGESMEQLGKRILLPGGIRLGNDVTVVINQRPSFKTGEINVVVAITYMRLDGEIKTVTEPRSFPIPSVFEGTEKAIRVSIGFIRDRETTEDTAALFKCFEVSRIDNSILSQL